jgi:hypothetical protein
MAKAEPFTPPRAKRFTREDAETALVLLEESRAGLGFIRSADRLHILDALDAAAALSGCARIVHSVAENACNGYRHEADEKADERREARAVKRAAAILAPYEVGFTTGGDPRGACFYLKTPRSKRHNTWGGAESGWAVTR